MTIFVSRKNRITMSIMYYSRGTRIQGFAEVHFVKRTITLNGRDTRNVLQSKITVNHAG